MRWENQPLANGTMIESPRGVSIPVVGNASSKTGWIEGVSRGGLRAKVLEMWVIVVVLLLDCPTTGFSEIDEP